MLRLTQPGLVAETTAPLLRSLMPTTMASHLTTVSKPAMVACGNLVAKKSSARASAVLYHYPCPDGAFAALAAHLYFSAACHKTLYFSNTVYSPVNADQLPLSEIGDLYLLDFVGPRGFVQEISPKVSGRVIVLDHHKTALEMFGEGDAQRKEGVDAVVDNNLVKVIDMSRSGATIAYDYFKRKLESEVDENHETVGEFRRLRRLFEYVEDGDLWKWKLPESKAFYHGLKDHKIEFDYNVNPVVFDQLRSLDLQSVIDLGIKNSSEKERVISEAVERSFEVALGGGEGGDLGRCLAVEVSEKVSELRSELGHQLACKSRDMGLRGIGAVAYRVAEIGDDSTVKVSLRGDGGEDTTEVSEIYGGGGHRSASSFMMRLEEFEKWRINDRSSN